MFVCVYCTSAINEHSLIDFAYSFSPLVEIAKSNTVVIDAEGCDLLFGSTYGLAKDIAERARMSAVKGGLDCRINVAVASNPDAAIHAAHNLEGITFISPGEELTCLGDFPITALDPFLVSIDSKRSDEILETLRLWGVRTFRDFALLPVAGVSERLGQEGTRLQKLAAGKTERHLKLHKPAQTFSSSIELEHSLSELEPLSFIFARMLNQLCASLNSYALATNDLLIELQLDDQTTHRRSLTLPYPMRDHKVFLKLLLLDTEMHPPQSAVRSVFIKCDPVKPRVLQSGLFVPLAPAPDKLELTLARLAKLVGEENVGSPSLLDTHRPDAFQIKHFVLTTKSNRRKRKDRQEPARCKQSLGFRMFRPPLRAIVQENGGCPQQISAWDKQRSVYGKVVQLAGPWRTTGDWWRVDGWARDEWDIALRVETNRSINTDQNLALYRIYRELKSGNWFVEGSYD